MAYQGTPSAWAAAQGPGPAQGPAPPPLGPPAPCSWTSHWCQHGKRRWPASLRLHVWHGACSPRDTLWHSTARREASLWGLSRAPSCPPPPHSPCPVGWPPLSSSCTPNTSNSRTGPQGTAAAHSLDTCWHCPPAHQLPIPQNRWVSPPRAQSPLDRDPEPLATRMPGTPGLRPRAPEAAEKAACAGPADRAQRAWPRALVCPPPPPRAGLWLAPRTSTPRLASAGSCWPALVPAATQAAALAGPVCYCPGFATVPECHVFQQRARTHTHTHTHTHTQTRRVTRNTHRSLAQAGWHSRGAQKVKAARTSAQGTVPLGTGPAVGKWAGDPGSAGGPAAVGAAMPPMHMGSPDQAAGAQHLSSSCCNLRLLWGVVTGGLATWPHRPRCMPQDAQKCHGRPQVPLALNRVLSCVSDPS